MADGDLAAAVAGWTKVLDSDDLRLGFGKIDQAADLALKYGQLRYANATALLASSGQGIGQRAIDLATGDEYRWNGTTWQLWSTPWKAYTPTWSGLTVGNGVNGSTYRYRDGQVDVDFRFVMGTTSSVTGSIIATLPVNGAANAMAYGQGHAFDGTRIYALYPFLNGGPPTGIRMRFLQVVGTTLGYADTTATAPFTWAATHELSLRFTYRVY